MNERVVSIVSFLITVLFFWFMVNSLTVAIGFLLLLFVHEMGHYLACRYKGIQATLPVFTPLGAMIVIDPLELRNAKEEAFIALAGPAVGGVASLMVLALAPVLGSHEMFLIGYYGLVLNLFNLIPLAPLDGGRISMAIERRMWVVGLPLLVIAFLSFGFSFLNLLVAILIFSQAWRDVKFRRMQAWQDPRYFNVGRHARLGYALAYVGLAALLCWFFFAPSPVGV